MGHCQSEALRKYFERSIPSVNDHPWGKITSVNDHPREKICPFSTFNIFQERYGNGPRIQAISLGVTTTQLMLLKSYRIARIIAIFTISYFKKYALLSIII